MSLNAQGYFNCLKSYLNAKHYGVHQPTSGEVVLTEKIFSERSEKKQSIYLKTDGDVLVIKLDAKDNKGVSPPLFHFLDDTAKPWSKRCDFVVFNLRRSKLHVYCIEFKSETIPDVVKDQLESSVAWCKALQATVSAYTSKRSTLNVTKYVLSNHPDPSQYLDVDGKYLKRDHTIRHYRYSELTGLALTDLENSNIEVIR